MWIRSPVLISAALLVAAPAYAHVTLETRQAAVGSAYSAVFVVPHGCAGSATIKLRVQIPEGVIVTEAKPTAGWTVETVKGEYAHAYDYEATKVSKGVKEVDWGGGRLPDKTRETFVVETFLTDGLTPGTTLYFPTVQECEQGVSRWIEIPAGDSSSPEGRWPAPAVNLTPKP